MASPVQRAAGAANATLKEFGLDERTANMTVKEYWAHFLRAVEEQLTAEADEAVDEIAIGQKQQREELRNLKHKKQLELAAKNKASKSKQWDVVLTLTSTTEEGAKSVGRSFTLQPRVKTGGMCRIGRSTGDNFSEPAGVSLPFDSGVSVWHGKFTCVYGQVFYTDLRTRNGSHHNGVRVEQDTPVPLKNGDTVSMGDTHLTVQLLPVASEEAADENALMDG